MSEEFRILDLAPDEIAELLAEDGTNLTEVEAAALKEFIEGIGGLENALLAVEVLRSMEKAA